jgi:DNA polymerase-1
MADERGTVLAVDGNSLVHRAFHAQAATGLRTPDGRPMWAVRGLLAQLVAAVERLDPDTVVVGFDDPHASLRRDRWPQYKAARTEKLDTLVSQLELAVVLLRELGVPVVVPPGLEADDVLAATARHCRESGRRCVVMTSDRDAFALIDEVTSVLRLINGGVEASPVLTPDRLELLLGIRPGQYRDYAALRGDPSDNLTGVRGVGPKTAARLLRAFGSAESLFAATPEQVAEVVGAALGRRLAAPGARECWQRNCMVMAFHDEVDLGRAGPDDWSRGVWPLSADRVRAVFDLVQLPATLPKALRVLSRVETAEPVERLAWRAADERFGDPRNWGGGTRRRHPPLAKPAVDEQPALFSL